MATHRSEDPAGRSGSSTAGLIVRWTGRALMILWGAFWLFFAIADGIGDWQQLHSPLPLLFELLIPLLGIAVLAAAWRWELGGGIGFLAVAVLFQLRFHYDWNTAMGRYAIPILLGPPVLTGLLLIVSWLLNRRPRMAHPAAT